MGSFYYIMTDFSESIKPIKRIEQKHLSMKTIRYHFFLITFAVFLVSCAGVKPVVKELRPVPQKLTILFTNNPLIAFEPTGCACRRWGGLARRAHFIQEAKQHYPSVIIIDTGNTQISKYRLSQTVLRKKADYLFAILNHLGTDALNVGLHECSMGLEYIRGKEKELRFPLLSANLLSDSTKEPLFKPFVIKTVNDLKIGIFGLTSGYENSLKMKRKDIIYIDNPITAAKKAVQDLQGEGCSLIILLSQLSPAKNKQVAQQVSGIHFILGSSLNMLQQKPKQVDRTAMLSAGNKGTHVGVLEINFINSLASFLDIENIEAFGDIIEENKANVKNPDNASTIEEIAREQVFSNEGFKSFETSNSYRYTVVVLDRTVQEDPQVQLIIEKYKEEMVRDRILSFKDHVPTVDISSLPEEKKPMARRLLNELICEEGSGSIADSADKIPFCRKLAKVIVDGIQKGEPEGKIRYSILYEKEKQKKILDKNLYYR